MALLLEQPSILTPRWTPLRHHPEQYRLWTSKARFRVVPAGRRSGKTEIAKRYTILQALREYTWPDAWFVFAAPTHVQARRIYWRDLKAMVPQEFRDGRPRESECTIRLINGAELSVIGMDEPARIEGKPLNGIILDEYGNMKQRVWGENIRPALSDRLGWAWFIGVPEGRNHYYNLSNKAQSGKYTDWDNFHWVSGDILPASEIKAAEEDLDPLTFDQEYNANFLNFQGRAYYTYTRLTHSAAHLTYFPRLSIIFAFDFNRAPGVCAILQEQMKSWYPSWHPIHKISGLNEEFTAVIGEVFIPKNSNTEAVCRKLLKDWGKHTGDVYLYGDATGGNKSTKSTKGSDWDIIKEYLKPAFNQNGITRLKPRVKKANPPQRARVNAMNRRLLTKTGKIRMLIDPAKAEHVCIDLEGVTLLEGGAGEIDKDANPELSHISDAVGYYVEAKHPIHTTGMIEEEVI
jgi:hypothetical protein